ncbi:unnamed protein product [Closterium sp. NIES-54]
MSMCPAVCLCPPPTPVPMGAQMTEKDERVVCYIINTAEYCHETAAQLAESVANRIDAALVGSVDISDEQVGGEGGGG